MVDVEDVELEGGHAFRMLRSSDMFGKLYRERNRFEEAGDNQRDQIDAAMNFAVTAWHLSEWVFGEFEAPLRAELDVENVADFQRYIRRQCEGLAAFDVIANAVKHGGRAAPRDYRPNVETILVAHAFEAEPNREREVQIVSTPERDWSLMIRIDNRDRLAADVLYEVYMFWYRYLQRLIAQRVGQ